MKKKKTSVKKKVSKKEKEVKIIGAYDTKGELIKFEKPVKVVRFDRLLCMEQDGHFMAVMDEYGDWVNPQMKQIGIKLKMAVVGLQ